MVKSPFTAIKLKLCTVSSLPIARNCLDSPNKCINATQFATFLVILKFIRTHTNKQTHTCTCYETLEHA